jgi:hypothetical protein
MTHNESFAGARKVVAFVPPTNTLSTKVKFPPAMKIVSPGQVVVGEKLVMDGDTVVLEKPKVGAESTTETNASSSLGSVVSSMPPMSLAEPPSAELGEEAVAKTYRSGVSAVIPTGKSARLTYMSMKTGVPPQLECLA